MMRPITAIQRAMTVGATFAVLGGLQWVWARTAGLPSQQESAIAFAVSGVVLFLASLLISRARARDGSTAQGAGDALGD